MTNTWTELVLDESKWLAASMFVAAVTAIVGLVRSASSGAEQRTRILRALNVYFGVLIGVMAFGHLLAVVVKAGNGTLEGTLVSLVPLGLVLGIPAWWLALRVDVLVADAASGGRALTALNAWIAVALLALGLHNFPLALPALFDLAYHFNKRRAVGWAIVIAAVATNLALFIGAVAFWIDGRSFEEFGM